MKANRPFFSVPKRILLADDFPPIRRAIRRILDVRTDWKILEAVDGMDAIKKAQASCPDIAVLDIAMPRMNGIVAAHAIRKYCSRTLVLVASLEDIVGFMKKIRGNDIRGFVSKSDLTVQLIPAIEMLLGGGTYFPNLDL
jgi:DNA-binding NarL/FixJ family response regulator